MHSLLEPLVIGRLNTKKGPREVVIEAGSFDNVYALDAKTGELLWKHHFDSTFHEEPGARASVLCPGGMTANDLLRAGAVAPPRIDRWRELYRSAVRQREIHHKILGDHSRPEVERNHSRRLRAQAESQIRLLTEAEGA